MDSCMKCGKATPDDSSPNIWCLRCRNDNPRYRRVFNQHRLAEIKSQGCERCSEDDPCCIDFHHIDPERKSQPGWVKMSDWSWKRILAEIERCIRLCSNCHRKHHYYEAHPQL